VSLYNTARQLAQHPDVKSTCSEEPSSEDELSFAELVAYIVAYIDELFLQTGRDF